VQLAVVEFLYRRAGNVQRAGRVGDRNVREEVLGYGIDPVGWDSVASERLAGICGRVEGQGGADRRQPTEVAPEQSLRGIGPALDHTQALLEVLEVTVDEDLVLLHISSTGRPVLIALEGLGAGREEVARVHGVVAEELEH